MSPRHLGPSLAAERRSLAGPTSNSLVEFVATPPKFLNVDLDIKSRMNLDGVAAGLGRNVMEIHSGRIGTRYWKRFELVPEPTDPDRAIRRFAALVKALRGQTRRTWNQAAKELDIGIEAGTEVASGEWALRDMTVQTLARIGTRLRITVYAPASALSRSAHQSKAAKRAKGRLTGGCSRRRPGGS